MSLWQRLALLVALSVSAGLGAVVVGAPARADVPLAAPGECAQTSPNTSLIRPVVYAPGGPVVGDPALLLGAAAVGTAPGGQLVPSPQAMGFPGTGSCDRPGSGCMGAIMPGPARPSGVTPSSGRTPTIRESPGQPAPPPGLP